MPSNEKYDPVEFRNFLRRANVDIINALAAKAPGDDLLTARLKEIAFGTEAPANWRAIWILGKANEKHPGYLLHVLGDIFAHLEQDIHPSVRGGWLRILARWQPSQAWMDKDDFINQCMETFKNMQYPNFVRYYAMKILIKKSTQSEHIRHELSYAIEQVHPAIQKKYMKHYLPRLKAALDSDQPIPKFFLK